MKKIEHQSFLVRADRATDINDSIEMAQAIERLSKRITKLEDELEIFKKKKFNHNS